MPDTHEIHAHATQAEPGQPCPCEQQTGAVLAAIASALFLLLVLDKIKSWWRKRKQPPAANGDKKLEGPP